MKKNDFCCVDNFSVLIPYRELEKMLESSNKIAHIEVLFQRVEERTSAMQVMYSEILEKVAEINRYLWKTHSPLYYENKRKKFILLRSFDSSVTDQGVN